MENHPPMGRMMALATRYEVSTQVDSSTLAERLPAMCGKETLATLVSSTSMNVASITTTAMTQGFTAPSSLLARPMKLVITALMDFLGPHRVPLASVIDLARTKSALLARDNCHVHIHSGTQNRFVRRNWIQ